MKIILLGMLIIFLLGMTAQLVVYTIIAYIKEDCNRKMMRTVFVKNTILRYEECTKLGIPVDNVKDLWKTHLIRVFMVDIRRI